jgi:hypothetical protein
MPVVRLTRTFAMPTSFGGSPRDRYCHTVADDGIAVIGPEGGEHVPRGERHHRVLCELPEYEVIELWFGPDFEGVDPHTHSDHVD